jgi:hypothetical protein
MPNKLDCRPNDVIIVTSSSVDPDNIHKRDFWKGTIITYINISRTKEILGVKWSDKSINPIEELPNLQSKLMMRKII